MSPDCQHSKVIFYSDQRTPASRRNSPRNTKKINVNKKMFVTGAKLHPSTGDRDTSISDWDQVTKLQTKNTY
jgi:hypothetical protein